MIVPAHRGAHPLVLGLLALGLLGCQGSDERSCCAPGEIAVEVAPNDEAEAISIPDVPLLDQDGKAVRFRSDLVRGKVVAISFIFTTCTTVCPLVGARYSELQRTLGDRLGRDFGLISISVDPATDTPGRLKDWGRNYHAGPGWTLVTGSKPEVDRLLKALGSFSGDKREHSPMILIVDGAADKGRRVGSQASPSRIARIMEETRKARPEPSPTPAQVLDHSAARRYFTDTVLLDQDGRERRFYSDLIEGKAVVINVFFSACKGSCPVMGGTLAKLQDRLGDRVGKDLNLISISVDPANDTPEQLREYARRSNARPGWYFLTGSKENVEAVLRKLGQSIQNRESHTPILFVGNDRTGLWKKGFGLAKSDEVIALVEGVLADKGP